MTDVLVRGIVSGTIGIVGVLRVCDECKKAVPKKAHEESLVETTGLGGENSMARDVVLASEVPNKTTSNNTQAG